MYVIVRGDLTSISCNIWSIAFENFRLTKASKSKQILAILGRCV